MRSLAAVVLATSWLLVVPVTPFARATPALAAGSFDDGYFREFTIFSGLTKPTSIRFATDGRAFVAEKAGRVKAFDSVADTTPTTVIDLRTDVNSYWDRGLLSLALDPGFLTGRPYLYLFYTYDAPPGQVAPVWNDVCPAAPGGTADGCVVTSRLDRYTVDLTTNVANPATRVALVDDWCQQFPSHSAGGLAFGTDGQLYAASGDGASFTVTDYGQKGGTLPSPGDPATPVNPCLDPVTLLSGPDETPVVDVPTAEGGALRSQDLRTTSDPVGLDGTLIRINPATGAASAGNPLSGEASANARRIVAHGFRNPFRITFRPGTSELYVADVGNLTWEEIERVTVPTTARTPATMPNYGWPCYEGAARGTWQSLGTELCTNLYAAGASAVTSPVYAYSHVDTRSPTGPCFAPDASGKMTSSVTGVAFYDGPTGGTVAYPPQYDGALFFADYSRDCLGAMLPGPGGVPDPATTHEVARGIAGPVDLLAGPGGDLYYVDLDGGRVIRIRYLIAPVARATASPPVSKAPVTVHLDGSTSTDPDPTSTLVAWRWDLDHDGLFGGPADAMGATWDWSITTPGVYPITLQVENSNGLLDTVELVVNADNDPPAPVIDTPSGALTWAVGDTIDFGGHASDPQDGAIGPAGLAWDVVMLHCPAECHEHIVQSLSGIASGSFEAPDHEYPSHLELRLTATDSAGAATTTSVELQPQTATVDVASSPAGVPIAVAGEERVSPSSTTVIRNGTVSVSPPVATSIGGRRHRFEAWGDGGPRVRDVVATGPVALGATYVPDAPDACADATSTAPDSTWIGERSSGEGDADWFRFRLASKRRVVITLGDLPVDGRLDLYGSCSTRLATSDSSGTRFEEITRVLAAGTYRVRVTAPGSAANHDPYVLRFRPMASGMRVKSSRTMSSGSSVRIVGELLNNTGATRGRATVRATFRDGSGRIVATLTGKGFARRLSDGRVTPFVVSGIVPGYASVTLSATSVSPPSVPSLGLTRLSVTDHPDGSATEAGTVKNTGSRTARGVAIARTWYSARGQVLERGLVTVSPSTLGARRSGAFSLTRPVLPGYQWGRTQIRGSY